MNAITSSNITTTQPQSKPSRSRLRVWILRIAIGLAIALAVLAAAGATYQAIASASDRRTYLAPGQLVDVGGHHLHLHCTGAAQEGSPTVILEAGGAMMSAHWAWVQTALAGTTHVCAYDRAGAGWSEAGPAPRDAQQIATELHTLLAQAGISGPYVLAGHSIGGLYVRAFAGRYPDEVAGLVLVDASHPDQMTRSPETRAEQESFMRLFKWFPLLARLGVLRISGIAATTATELPAQQRAAAATFFAAAGQHTATLAELAAWDSTASQARTAGSLGNKPLFILTAGAGSAPGWGALQEDLIALSSNSYQLVAEGATHQGLLKNQQDAQITSAAILEVMEAVRTGQSLAP
jgi:pimeloyl-ACP methyl ester carboxylesterase